MSVSQKVKALLVLADEYAHQASMGNEFDNRNRVAEARLRLMEALCDALNP